MAKSKSSAQRKPVKARGSLPAPRTAPKRNFVPIHRRRPIQIAAGVVILALIGLVIWRALDARGDVEQERRAIRRFENSANLLFNGLSQTVNDMSSQPTQLGAGITPPDQFQAAADAWIKELREVNVSLREKKIPSELHEARSLSVHSVLFFLDAAKSFKLAAQVPEGETRVAAIANGENLMVHAQSLITLFQREMNRVKLEVGMVSESESGLDKPLELPPEEREFPFQPSEGEPNQPQP
jgi:hypothetical protein